MFWGRHMSGSLRGRPAKLIAIVVGLMLLGGRAGAQAERLTVPANASPPGPPAQQTVKTQPPLVAWVSADAFRIPAGAVIVLCDRAQEALRLLPRAVVLKPEEYQRLLDQLEQFKRLAAPGKPETPSSCKLTAQVESELVRVHVEVGFRTVHPQTLVHLGFRQAWPTAAALDGQLPILRADELGLVLMVETSGVHHASVDLVMALDTRRGVKGNEQGFDLDLPGAAITTLERLELPSAVAEVRIGSRTVRPQASAGHGRIENLSLLATDHLEAAWKAPVARSPGPPLLAALGRLKIRLQDQQVFTDAELTLQVLRGETAQWRILVPFPVGAGLDVKTQPPGDPRVQAIDVSSDLQNPMVTVRLKGASNEPVQLAFHTRQMWPGDSVPIKPFAVVDALTQKGDLEICAPEDLRLRYQLRGELSQRELTEEQQRDQVRAAFTYWTVAGSPVSALPTLLELQAETVRGAVEVRVGHALRLDEKGPEGGPAWHVTSRIDVTPIRTVVERMEISLPPGYHYDRDTGAAPAELVEEVVPDPIRAVGQIRLAQRQARPFSITLNGTYVQPAGRRQASVELPRPLRWKAERREPQVGTPFLDRGGLVRVTLPASLELSSERPGTLREPALQEVFSSFFFPTPPRPGTHSYAWQTERLPQQLDLAWRPFRPDLPLRSVADVTLAGRHAHVRQRLLLQFPRAPLSQVQLRIPREVRKHLQIITGGTTTDLDREAIEYWPVQLTAPVGKEHELTLEYTVSAGPADARDSAASYRLRVPLVQVLEATRGETRVRVWADPGVQPGVAGSGWEEAGTEVVAERDSLPALVLRGGLEDSIPLTWVVPSVSGATAALVERVLVRVAVAPGGTQTFHVGFFLARLNHRQLDLDLPVLLTAPELEVRLGGKQVPFHLLDDAGREASAGRTARLLVDPDLCRPGTILSVRCHVEPAQGSDSSGWHLDLRPPRLAGAAILGRTAWTLELPADWLPVVARGARVGELHWLAAGGLLVPRPAAGAEDLEAWLQRTETRPQTSAGAPSLICWQAAPAPVELIWVPERLWLLACSLPFVVIGVFFLWAPLARAVFWASVVCLAAALALGAVLWPDLLTQIAYGCEPGAIVLPVLAGVQALVQRHRRRHALFPQAFARVPSGSSLTRGGDGVRPREVSTVEQQPRRGSSVSQPSAS
jgi:hypothetical protein